LNFFIIRFELAIGVKVREVFDDVRTRFVDCFSSSKVVVVIVFVVVDVSNDSAGLGELQP